MKATPMFLRLFRQLVARAFARALPTAGMRRPARMVMMAMTVSSSMRVKERDCFMVFKPRGGVDMGYLWVCDRRLAGRRFSGENPAGGVADVSSKGNYSQKIVGRQELSPKKATRAM